MIKKLLHPLVKEYRTIMDRKRQDKYLTTSYSKRMKSYCNVTHKKRCFIIGNGPSLSISDLDRLVNEDCFACNRIYGLYSKTKWRPLYYCSQDTKVITQIKEDIPYAIENCKDCFLSYRFKKILENEIIENEKVNLFYSPYVSVYGENNTYSEGIIPFSNDASIAVYDGLSITYGMIQIAVYMGYKEIYLLGVDHNYQIKNGVVDATNSYVEGIKPIDMSTQFPPELILCEISFREAKRYCMQHGIKIYNATRGGKLEIFDRVDLDEILNKGEENEE